MRTETQAMEGLSKEVNSPREPMLTSGYRQRERQARVAERTRGCAGFTEMRQGVPCHVENRAFEGLA